MNILWIKRLAAAVLFSAAALTTSAQKYSGGLIDKTVAIVGNEVIMLSDLEDEVAMMKAYGMMSDKKGRCEILEEMMATKLFLMQARLDSLAVNNDMVEGELSNRLDMLLERPDLDEEMASELVKLKRSLQHLIRLNKTMLLLAKIENDRFPDKVEVNIGDMLADSLAMHDEIYSYKGITSVTSGKGDFACMMNEQMASVLVGNLVKNAYVHSSQNASVHVEISEKGFSISNPGDASLDKDKLFKRFYQPGGRKEGSTGLGLALAYTVCERNGLMLSYDFSDNRHIFHVILKNSR